MKNLIWILAVGVLFTGLAVPENAGAFRARLFANTEFSIEGTAKTTIKSTGDYFGTSKMEGYLVELNGAMQGSGEVSPDFSTRVLFDVTTNYYCDIQAPGYDWDNKKNILRSTNVEMACYDRIAGDSNPFIGANDCRMVLRFSNATKFNGRIICTDDVNDFKFVGNFKGTKLGTYNPMLLQQP